MGQTHVDSEDLRVAVYRTLGTLWRLASRWYEGRLDHGYARREPADYFRSVGLRGPFWGL